MQASTSVAAGGSQTSTTLSLTTSLGASVVARVVNGATAPTIGCDVILEYQDGTNWFESARATAGLTNAATYDLVFAIRPEIQNVRLRFTGHTGQAVTVEAHAHVLSSVA
jgi:hypothetical protein